MKVECLKSSMLVSQKREGNGKRRVRREKTALELKEIEL